MTSIPDATEEDFEGIRNIEEIYAETEEILKGYGLMDCNDKIAIESVLELSYLRIISHYQRDNERLKEEKKILSQWICENPIRVESEQDIANGIAKRDNWEIEMAKARIDALSGEGGGE